MSESNAKTSFFKEVFSKKMGICLIAGFSSGMPLYVLITLLMAYLRKEGVDLKSIGIMSLVTFPYTWKFLWAPLLDRFNPLSLGRRRGFMLLSQILLIFSIGFIGFCDPSLSLYPIAAAAFLTSLLSATQDIAVDAYRREILNDDELGLGNSLFVNAYRVSGLIPGGASLIIADFVSWRVVFVFTALFMLPGLILSLKIKEPIALNAPRDLKSAVTEPFKEFINRKGIGYALLVILFVFLYKLGDSMATALATPFYIDLGYDLMTIGIVGKNVGLWSMVIGGVIGGLIMLRIGIDKALWLFGAGQSVTILGFYLLASQGSLGTTPPIWFLTLTVSAEYLGAGLGTAAFVSFIASITNQAYTATQFALLTSLSAIPRTFCNASTGFLVESLGWENFFLLCTLLSLPGLLLLIKIAPIKLKSDS